MNDEELKRLVQEAMEAELEEAERILEIVNSDPVLKDVKCPDSVRVKLFEQIREYEEQKRLENLTEEERENIRLGKIYRKRRKWNRYIVVAAALIAILAIGTVSIGEDKNILTILKQMISGEEQTFSDSGSTEPIQFVEEQAVFEKIEETYGFEPVKLEYLPRQTVFQEAMFYTDMQGINMYYGTADKANIIYTIRPNYREGSFTVVVEDRKIQEYSMGVNDVVVSLTEYEIIESKENRWSISWVYQEVQYVLSITGAEQVEVEKIVNSLSFFE